MSGMNGRELAAALDTLAISGTKKIGRISLVGCNLGAQPAEKGLKFSSNTFLMDFLKALRSKYHIDTTVSARTSRVQVGASGRKYTEDITPEGIKWYNKNPKRKLVVQFDNDNVVYNKVDVTKDPLVYPCKDCNSLGFPLSTVDEVRDLHSAAFTNSKFWGQFLQIICAPSSACRDLNVQVKISTAFSVFFSKVLKNFTTEEIWLNRERTLWCGRDVSPDFSNLEAFTRVLTTG